MTLQDCAKQLDGDPEQEAAEELWTRRDCFLTEVMPRGWGWAYQYLINVGQEDHRFVRRIG